MKEEIWITIIVILVIIISIYVYTQYSIPKEVKPFEFYEDPYEIKRLRKPIIVPIMKLRDGIYVYP